MPPDFFSRKLNRIKHSLPTAFRQATARLVGGWHRLAPKMALPNGRLKVGVLGAGNFFHYAYLPALNQAASALAVSGIHTRQLASFHAAQRGLSYRTRFFPTAEALLDSGISAALILLPNQFHFSAVRAALERGLQVYCEKPLAASIAEARELQMLAAENNCLLMTGFNQRFSARNRALGELLSAQRIGPLRSVHAFHNQDLRGLKSFAPLHREVTGGGVLLNAGIHFLNLFRHWFGEPERVTAIFENRALPRDCGEDTARCELFFPSGLRVTLDASLANAVDTTYERIQLLGETGEITSDLKRSEIWLRPSGKPQLKIPCAPEIISDSVGAALEHFAACVKNGSTPLTDANDYIGTLRIIAALTLAAERGSAVTLAELK